MSGRSPPHGGSREWLRRPRRLRNAVNLAYGLLEESREPDLVEYPHHGDRVVDHLLAYLEGRSGPQLSFVNLLDPHNPHHSMPPQKGADPSVLRFVPRSRRRWHQCPAMTPC